MKNPLIRQKAHWRSVVSKAGKCSWEAPSELLTALQKDVASLTEPRVIVENKENKVSSHSKIKNQKHKEKPRRITISFDLPGPIHLSLCASFGPEVSRRLPNPKLSLSQAVRGLDRSAFEIWAAIEGTRLAFQRCASELYLMEYNQTLAYSRRRSTKRARKTMIKSHFVNQPDKQD